MDDDALVAYVVRAKKSGSLDHATNGMFMLLYRHEARMVRRVQMRLPTSLQHHADTVAQWVLEKVWQSALKLPLKGESVGEWVNWTKTAIDRQVVSFFRSRQGQSLEKEQTWPGEQTTSDGDSIAPDTIGEDFNADGIAVSLDYRQAIDKALDALNPQHRAVVEAAYFEDRPSKDVGAEFDESVENVDQIKKRFRDGLREELTARGVWDS